MKDNIRRNLKSGYDVLGKIENKLFILFLDKGELAAIVMTLWHWTFIYRAFAHFSCMKYSPFEKYFKKNIHQNLMEHVIKPIKMQINITVNQ